MVVVHRLKQLLGNLSLAICSLLLLLLFLELVIFRFIFIPSDFPELYFENGIIKYKPNQKGVHYIKNENKSLFNINDKGWNSRHNSYEFPRTKGKYRIAVIGDSYVEAKHVNYYESFAEQLEDLLGNSHYEVYRFGIIAAPMSQYLQMLRMEVSHYKPDLAIIVLVHNDFSESYQFTKLGTYFSSFLKLEIMDNNEIREILPVKFEKQWYHFIRNNSALWGYFVYRQNYNIILLKNLILGTDKNKTVKFQANINISNLDELADKNRIATEYIFKEIKQICIENDIKLLIIMDGDRGSLYSDTVGLADFYKKKALSLNKIAMDVSSKYGIHFIDLHPVFESDYKKNHKRFNYFNDFHWNYNGHHLVAKTLYEYIK